MIEENQNRLLEAAKELFFMHGIKRVTVDDICRHIGVSKKTLYLFFKNKEELIECLLEKNLNEHKKEFEQIFKKSNNSIQEIILLMEHLAVMFSEINPYVFYDLQKYHPDVWKQFKEFKETFLFQIIVKNLEKGIQEDLYRHKINIEILARLRIEETQMALNPLIFHKEKYKISDIQIELLDHFLHGITTLKGHKLINKYRQINEEE
ncbi:TetR/AcrR family transcriptional regulator [Flavobacterium sp. UBA7680]|uniref:TetR/AcrR family transcriptional regulator n=1 Tax=Flavobacterium sp. UBA7680 TaxID=1946559 RepID=UPI0025C1AE55|nr:TetR/AcrR family transcriptional regulator [Flavobacterium sp. UBA7680]